MTHDDDNAEPSGFKIEVDDELGDELASQADEPIVNRSSANTLLNISVDTVSDDQAKPQHLSTGQFAASKTNRTPTGHVVTSTVSGRYEIKKEFARGGMGRILLAFDSSVGREVALKELLPEIEENASSSGSTGVIDRFLREAKVTGQLEHPNIVPVYEIGQREDGRTYYTMKFVQGKTLESRLRGINGDESIDAREKLARRLRLLEPFLNVCHAVAYAHSRNVIHRDLKPANIMLGDYGETLVLDWGLARVLDQPFDEVAGRGATGSNSTGIRHEDSSSKTLDGAVLGTPAYMPPEQARGDIEQVDCLSDVYSLGALLYEILAGKPPFVGEHAQTILARVQVTEPDQLEPAHGAPADLIALCNKAMARDKEDRLESAELFVDEIAAFRDGRQLSVYRYAASEKLWRFVTRHKAPVAIAIIALVAMIVGGVYSYNKVSNERDSATEALSRADFEEQRRVGLQEKQEGERRELIAVRQKQIDDNNTTLDKLGIDAILEEAKDRRNDINNNRNEGNTNTLTYADKNIALIEQLMEVMRGLSHRIDLEIRPVGGVSHNFVSAAELKRQKSFLLDVQSLACALALANSDFALADFIAIEMDIDGEKLDIRRESIKDARNALLAAHGLEIQAALDDIRKGMARPNRPRDLPDLEEYVHNISAYREPQTYLAISQALSSQFTFNVTAGNRSWTASQRDEITFCCRVLGFLRLPHLAVPMLSSTLDALSDDRLLVEAGRALCRTKDSGAEPALERLRERLKDRPHIWSQVLSLYRMVPNLPLPANPSTDDILHRARIMITKEQRKEALAVLKPWLDKLDKSTEYHYLYGQAAPSTRLGEEHMLRVIELDQAHIAAHLAIAGFYVYLKKPDRARYYADKCVELAPGDWRSWGTRGFVYSNQAKEYWPVAIESITKSLELNPQSHIQYTNRAAVYINMGEYDKAELDLSRALYLNPQHAEAYINRSLCRMNLKDYDGAIQDCTKLLEIHPGHPWGIINRATAYRLAKEFNKAILDYSVLVDREQTLTPDAYIGRAQCYIALEEYGLAEDDLYYFIDEYPEHAYVSEAEELLRKIEDN